VRGRASDQAGDDSGASGVARGRERTTHLGTRKL